MGKESARLKRAIASAPCAEVGHRWKFVGGCNACCSDECNCSVPVHECEVCGDCDYGENEEAREIIAKCEARHEIKDFPR
jgi:hypothetical protein